MEELKMLLQNMFITVDFEDSHDLIQDGILDSLDLLKMISVLEKKYDITISWDEITDQNFNSLSSIYDLISKHINNTNDSMPE